MSLWSFLYILINIASVAALIYLIVILASFKNIPAANAFKLLSGGLILWLIILTYRGTFVFSPGQVIFLHRMTETLFLFLPIAVVNLVDQFATKNRIMRKWFTVFVAIVILTTFGIDLDK